MIENNHLRLLYSIWQELIGKDGLSIYDDFFAIGGNPLLLERLKRMLSSRLGIDYILFPRDKFRYLHQQIEFLNYALSTSTDKTIIKLKPGKIEEPLVIIHPIGGTLFTYNHLLEQLKTKYTILGIQEGFITGNYILYDSIEDQANRYIKKLTKYTDQSSMILLGHSYGGTMAFEMARQLNDSGYEIKHLIMFDTWPSIPFNIQIRKNFINAISRQTSKIKSAQFCTNENDHKIWLETMQHRMQSLIKYQPKYTPVNATLFKASETLSEYKFKLSSDYGWSKHLDNLEVYSVPGHHENITSKNNIGAAASIIDQLLHRLETS